MVYQGCPFSDYSPISAFFGLTLGKPHLKFHISLGGQGGLVVKRLPGNQKIGGSNLVGKTKNGNWDSPLHRRCPNGLSGPEWKTS